MPFQLPSNFLTLGFLVSLVFVIALWMSLIVWVVRDIRERSRDVLAVLFAVIVVVVFPFVGVLIYLVLRPSETLARRYERALEEETLLQAIEERPSCPGCSRIVQSDWLICPYCHTTLKKDCVHCDRKIELNWTVCPYCAAPQAIDLPIEQGDQIDPFPAAPPESEPAD